MCRFGRRPSEPAVVVLIGRFDGIGARAFAWMVPHAASFDALETLPSIDGIALRLVGLDLARLLEFPFSKRTTALAESD